RYGGHVRRRKPRWMQLAPAWWYTLCRGERGTVERVALCMKDAFLLVLHALRARQHCGQGSVLRKGQNAVCKAKITGRLAYCPRRQAADVALPGPPRSPHTHGVPATASVACRAGPGRPDSARLREMAGVPGVPRSDRDQHR